VVVVKQPCEFGALTDREHHEAVLLVLNCIIQLGSQVLDGVLGPTVAPLDGRSRQYLTLVAPVTLEVEDVHGAMRRNRCTDIAERNVIVLRVPGREQAESREHTGPLVANGVADGEVAGEERAGSQRDRGKGGGLHFLADVWLMSEGARHQPSVRLGHTADIRSPPTSGKGLKTDTATTTIIIAAATTTTITTTITMVFFILDSKKSQFLKGHVVTIFGNHVLYFFSLEYISISFSTDSSTFRCDLYFFTAHSATTPSRPRA